MDMIIGILAAIVVLCGALVLLCVVLWSKEYKIMHKWRSSVSKEKTLVKSNEKEGYSFLYKPETGLSVAGISIMGMPPNNDAQVTVWYTHDRFKTLRFYNMVGAEAVLELFRKYATDICDGLEVWYCEENKDNSVVIEPVYGGKA